jgi:hypothetical protein
MKIESPVVSSSNDVDGHRPLKRRLFRLDDWRCHIGPAAMPRKLRLEYPGVM